LPTNITPDQFIAYVETYSTAKFKEAFEIDFPNTTSTAKEKHWKAFFEFANWYPSSADIQDKVQVQLFGYELLIS
jgi:hypothetical protein